MMVMTTDLLYAFEPVVVDLVDWMGPVITFAFGGVLLIVTGYIFRKTTQNVNFTRASEEADAKCTEGSHHPPCVFRRRASPNVEILGISRLSVADHRVSSDHQILDLKFAESS